MRRVFWVALALAGCLAALSHSSAQAPAGGNGSGNKPPVEPGKAAPAPTQSGSNPFPEDTNSVPVMPAKDTPPAPATSFSETDSDSGSVRVPVGSDAADPVHSPDDPVPSASEQNQESSSSLTGLGNLLPPPDSDEPDKKHKKEPTHQEAAAEDINVGGYYLDRKNWKAALSRFQSAMVLDPENPDVYWGLAEAEHHIGDLMNARAHYEKLLDYDPDGPHGKQARKALKDPAFTAAQGVAPSLSSPEAPLPQQAPQ